MQQPNSEMKRITAFAPATVANVACGFDVLGFALHEPGDEVVLSKNNDGEVRIISITGDEGRLPLEAENNTAGVAVLAMRKELGYIGGVDITLRKYMPMGSGMGSSAASAVAGAVAFNALLENHLPRKDLLPFILEGERVACGTAHADNAAASLLGGFILVRSHHPLDVVSIPYPKELAAVVIHPHIEINTGGSRRILRKQVALSSAVQQWANVGGLVAGLITKDFGLISRSLEDVIIEPTRGLLIPGFDAVKHAAISSGALGGGISGSGPSIFALCEGEEVAKKASIAMKTVLDTLGLGCDIHISAINPNGAQVR